MRRFIRALFSRTSAEQDAVAAINRLRLQWAASSEEELRSICLESHDLNEVIAVTAVTAEHALGLRMFDVQLAGALALASGQIAEMQTGEGKTLTAVPAVIWLAKSGQGVHVMTVNDYLARRDAAWMGEIYRKLGFTVSAIQQGISARERRRAYAADITYATANEVGFDFLRDQLALRSEDQVHRPFAAALIDEADSILIDEARIPLVIAGGEQEDEQLAVRACCIVARLRHGWHFTIEENSRNVSLTDAGIREVERGFQCGNLFARENLSLLSAAQDALHARALLRRDVDYIVKNGAIESVDEFKGRVARDRRWPAGLHTAIEVKEGVARKTQGRILGSITLQNLIALYPRVCGMTGTAATQADELRRIYALDVAVIPTNRPVIRIDHPDLVFRTRREKEQMLLEEIRTVHRTGRLAQAGLRGAVTISTNMAGRGTDICLGEGVAELGGLHVIGTNRHESRRIDFQLRGRAGRQGDPGSSRFVVSLEDDLVERFGTDAKRLGHTPESVQRAVEGTNLDVRLFLQKYEAPIEGQRQMIQKRREEILAGEESEYERMVALRTIDDLWADYLAAVSELRSGIQWVSWGGRDPLHEYLTQVDRMFRDMIDSLEEETALRMEQKIDPAQRGATWTYLTTDNPFGSWTERIVKGIIRKACH